MRRFPEEFDISFLEGKEIERICFLAYHLNIYLSEKTWIQIEGRYELTLDGHSIETVSEFPIERSMLLQLIGGRVLSASFSAPNGDILLKF
jgi:hypothetical protein